MSLVTLARWTSIRDLQGGGGEGGQEAGQRGEVLGVSCDLGALRASRGTGAIDNLCRVGVDLAPAAVRVTAHWHYSLSAIRRFDSRVADIRAGECR